MGISSRHIFLPEVPEATNCIWNLYVNGTSNEGVQYVSDRSTSEGLFK